MYLLQYKTYIEIISVISALAYTILCARQKSFAWPLGIFSSILTVYIYVSKNLYIRSLYNFIKIFLYCYGWYQWGFQSQTKKDVIKISKFNNNLLGLLMFLTSILSIFLGYIFYLYTPTASPYLEAFHMLHILLAIGMITRKKLEGWLLWMIIDWVSLAICLLNHLYIFTLKYLIYQVIAINSYFRWKKELNQNDEETNI